MTFNKQDISLTHYSWNMDDGTAGELFSGEPSRRVFDPTNGHQVLYLINCYAAATGRHSAEDVHTLENMIAQQMPIGQMSERSAFKWMMENN